MNWAIWAIDAFVAINFLSFTLMSTKLFRLDHVGWSSYIFSASFVMGTSASVWYMVHGSLVPLWALAAAAVVASLSCALFVSAAKVISSKPLTAIFSTDKPTFIHRSGPYRLMRHPFYVAYVLNFAAAYLISLNSVTLGLFAAAAIIYTYAAKVEEKKFASSELAEQYRDYSKKTSLFKHHEDSKDG